jgi:hypothetical protein
MPGLRTRPADAAASRALLLRQGTGAAVRVDRRRLLWGLGLTLLVAGLFVTRLWHLDAASLWEDDYLNLDRALMPLADMAAIQKWQGPADTIFDFQGPLVYALQHVALGVDASTLAARIPSVLASLLTPFGLWLLGRRLFGPAVGLVAALFGVFLLYPLDYAQAIKSYALLLCLTVYSLWLVVRAVEQGTRRAWAAYGLCALAMLYTGYQGLPAFAAQCLWAAACLLPRRSGDAPGTRRCRMLRFAGTCALVTLAYLPWLPAVFFASTFLSDPSVHPWAGVGPAFARKILGGLVALDPKLPLGFLLAWLAALGFGVWTCARRRQWRGLGLLVLTAGATSLALVGSRSLLRPILEARHFVMTFPALVLLAACGVDGLREAVVRVLARFRAGRLAANAAVLLACLLLLWPSLAAYSDFYARSLSLDREFFHWLDGARSDTDALEFHGYKRNTRRFAARWHLPGRFGEAGTFAAPGYRRILDSDTFYNDAAATRPRLPGVAGKEFGALFTTTRVSLSPVAGRAPLVMDPGPDGVWRYTDDFRDRAFYADAASARNMTLDTELGMLRPARYEQPAQATWILEVPPGTTLSRLRLSVTAALYKKHPTVASDAALVVSVGPDPGHLAPIGVIGQAQFPEKDGRPVTEARPFFDEIPFYGGRCRVTTLTYDVPAGLAVSGRLAVRVSYQPGHKEGFLNLAGIGFTADLRGTPAATGRDSPLALQAGHLLHNIRAVRWDGKGGANDLGLFAFAAPGYDWLAGIGLPVGTPEEAAAFLAAHPGISPAATLADREGRTALAVYDPALVHPGIGLCAATPTRRLRGLKDFGPQPASLRLTGTIAIPKLRLGETSLTIPVIAPAGSTLTLTPGGKGRIVFTPDWTTGLARLTAAMSYARDLAVSKRLRGELTCREGADCAFAYTFVTALPVRELRLRAYPQVYANPCRQCPPNEADVAVSTDGGKTYRKLVAGTGGEECSWTPDDRYVVRRVRFDPPATHLVLAFSLQHGDQAGFLSPSWNVDDMHIEADLDASSLPPLHLSGPDLDVSLANPGTNDFTLFLRPGPWPLSMRTSERGW